MGVYLSNQLKRQMTAPKEKPKRIVTGRNAKLKEVMKANPHLSIAEANSLMMKELREMHAKRREVLKDFAPEKAREPIDKMLQTVEKKKTENKRRILADMDLLEREEVKRRARKGLPQINDQVMIPLSVHGNMDPVKVLTNIQEMQKPAHIKEAFIATFNALQESGNEPYSLTAWAKLNPSQFYLLISKLIPQQAVDEKNLPLNVKSITFE